VYLLLEAMIVPFRFPYIKFSQHVKVSSKIQGNGYGVAGYDANEALALANQILLALQNDDG
jgi:hypothetical protein